MTWEVYTAKGVYIKCDGCLRLLPAPKAIMGTWCWQCAPLKKIAQEILWRLIKIFR